MREVSAKVGYEMGRLTPYLTTGIALAKPNSNPGAGYFSAADSTNNIFNGSTDLAASGVIGAGLRLRARPTIRLSGSSPWSERGRGGFVAPP